METSFRRNRLLGSEHVGGIDVALAPSSFGQANTQVDKISNLEFLIDCLGMSLFYLIYQSSLNHNSFQHLRDIKSLRMYNSLFDTIKCWNCWGWRLWLYLPLLFGHPSFRVPFCVPASHRTHRQLTNIRCLTLSYVYWEKSYLYVSQKYVPYGAAVAHLYAGAGVIGLSLAATRKRRQERGWFKFSGSLILMSN